jgi:hypothetical protein
MIESALALNSPEAVAYQAQALSSGDWRSVKLAPTPLPLEQRAWQSVLTALTQRGLTHINRVYLGSAYCHFLRWSKAELATALQTVQSANLNSTIVLDPQDDSSLKQSTRTIASLVDRFGSLEVEANDWGSLVSLGSTGAEVVAGPLLFKMKRLPRLTAHTRPIGIPTDMNVDVIRRRQLAEWSQFPADCAWAEQRLDALGIKRLEVEMVPQGIHFSDTGSRSISLHLPWTYITGGGSCPLLNTFTEKDVLCCTRNCRKTVIEAKFDSPTVPLRQFGHTVFAAMHGVLSAYCNEKRISRWVISPVVPM